ncbi:hypothetical protein OIO90_003320 [Microbotryomycetes sp. JL221]|nr:hypothetical protein OIO90_003320 [Microbotryomycetes sp. JL221]
MSSSGSTTTTVTSRIMTHMYDKLNTRTGQLCMVAIASATVTSITLFGLQQGQRKLKRRNLRDSIESSVNKGDHDTHSERTRLSQHSQNQLDDFTREPLERHNSFLSDQISSTPTTTTPQSTTTTTKQTSQVIIDEALARNSVFFGQENMNKIRQSFVVVVGLGGVGSATATMLVRSGVKKIRLIDFDQVSLTTLAQVGIPKVVACQEYFKQIAPWVEVDARVALFSKDEADELLQGNPDYVIDAIDNIDTKVQLYLNLRNSSQASIHSFISKRHSFLKNLQVDLISYCYRKQIKVFSSFGAGAKSDPSTIQVSDISFTFEDPLARVVRRKLKLEGINHGIPVVYSTEKPRKEINLLPLPEEEFKKGKVNELSLIQNFRVRILPVLGPIPAMFGNAAATYVLLDIAGFNIEPLPVKNRTKMSKTIHSTLTGLEQKLTGQTRIPLSEEDVQYIYEEIFRCRSITFPMKFIQKPNLVRWNKNLGCVWNNLVLFDREEAILHVEECLIGDKKPFQVWGQQVVDLVEKRFQEEERIRHWRE